jgi:hypothetical protein
MYDVTEMLISNPAATAHSGNITIPGTATAATVRMRLRCIFSGTMAGGDACTSGLGGWGETEDYYVTLVSPCQGPVFTSHPTNQNFCSGGSAGFSAAATSAATYVWQVKTSPSGSFVDISNGPTYSGATTNSLTLSNTPASYASYQYRLKSVSGCGTPSYSNAATLTIFPSVAVTAQTKNILICEDAITSMSVTASGTASGYQWQMGTLTNGYVNVPNQFPYSGVNSQQLDIAVVHDTLNGISFRCIVGGPCSADTSADIPMDVIEGPYISEDPVNDTTLPYITATFDVAVTNFDYILYWQASTDNGATFVNINNSSLYSGVDLPILYINNPTPAQTGTKFRCVMKSTNPACGLLRDTSEIATLYVGHYGGTKVSDVNKSAAEITLYPNPATGNEIFLNGSKLPVSNIEVKIIDKLGRVLSTSTIDLPASKVASIAVNSLPVGIYTIQVSDVNGNMLSTSAFTKQ